MNRKRSTPRKVSVEQRWAFGKRIAEIREMHGYDQKQLGELIGASPSSVSCWETGRCFPNWKRINKLCQIFHMNRVDLDSTIRS
jgi:DNA-binding XRE family transcriptional regulator